jgi:hypothetical protein
MTEEGEVCDMNVFDYDSWKIRQVKDVVLKNLHFDEEVLI